MWNKAKAILLPSNENNNPVIGKFFEGTLILRTSSDIPRGVAQHLYIINDDVIKELPK